MSISFGHFKPVLRLTAMLMACLLSSTALAQEDEIIFPGSEVSPWRLYLGSSTNWMVPVEGAETTSHESKLLTVRYINDDVVQAQWKTGLGQIYWQEENVRDYRELTQQGGALTMVIRVDKAPKKPVEIKMDCGYPCAGTLDMTKLLETVPTERWFRMSMSLSCFEAAGADMSNIVAPLVIATKGSFKLSISDVRLTSNPPKESLVPCS